MAADTKENLTAAKARMGAFAKASPNVMKAFGQLAGAATTEGRFTAAQKELLATAIAVVEGCEDCILYHVDAARRQGAEEEELVEALAIAVEMGGGPALMYAGKALECFRNLSS
ncbi:alkylhydroperoxidase AhpD family core domain-containing protein [Paracoccus isoporae]|uniref:Alkylhydroperoxidase AhpD family core domain-containing protein n=1 Tax=Paracoccus isoporae TaxID=591205 RepID=A0A1G7H501_9RHOB|nr:carboxymuconolactone decarboxylase family protein [Paracoccus isoporae]SDE95502.1 alkylhydroperoxidase AhpD family core domain-containing protein [Paracoccus isoporae]